jgi:RNA polymerase sigma-70 factor (ECF subfamily)
LKAASLDNDAMDEKPAPDDWTLAERVRGGDDAAFDALMARYKRPILSFVFRLLGDAAEAEDVAQEMFVRAYRGMQRPRFRKTSAKFSTWLFQIARHAALDSLRRRRRHPAESLSALADRGEEAVAREPTAADNASARETGGRIAAAVALLPEDQRTALVLAEYENLPHADIAAVMRCSVKSVEARLYRARRFLRARLADLLAELAC